MQEYPAARTPCSTPWRRKSITTAILSKTTRTGSLPGSTRTRPRQVRKRIGSSSSGCWRTAVAEPSTWWSPRAFPVLRGTPSPCWKRCGSWKPWMWRSGSRNRTSTRSAPMARWHSPFWPLLPRRRACPAAITASGASARALRWGGPIAVPCLATAW